MKICDAVNSDQYKSDRAILHSDCNCFYASVECLLNPNIRELPVAVSGDAENRHGIILAKNEIAKRYSVKTGEAIWQAKKKCPQLLTVPARLDVYKKFSDKVRRIYAEYTDMVEPFGLDESWLDISQNYKSDALTVAKEISERVKDEIGITVSIGVSLIKFSLSLAVTTKSLTPLPALQEIIIKILFGILLQATCSMWEVLHEKDLSRLGFTQ